MTRRVIRSPAARADVVETVRYLADRDLDAAARFSRAVRATEAVILDTPGLGAPRGFRNEYLQGLRMHPVQGFKRWLIFYLERPGAIEIVRVLHGARDLETLPGEGEE